MDMDRLTDKSKQAPLEAQSRAAERGHSEVDDELVIRFENPS